MFLLSLFSTVCSQTVREPIGISSLNRFMTDELYYQSSFYFKPTYLCSMVSSHSLLIALPSNCNDPVEIRLGFKSFSS